jgi:hypothetical protein
LLFFYKFCGLLHNFKQNQNLRKVIFNKWFKKTSEDQAPNLTPIELPPERLELISIHIPKTAGTSFRNTLKTVYGDDHVARLDIGLYREIVNLNEQEFLEPTLPSHLKVIHGHFSYEKLNAHFDILKTTPVITWLRDPVERVMSNYFYLVQRLHDELQEEKKGLDIIKKLKRSLSEYAMYPAHQNRLSKFLAGIELEQLFFVGFTDNYNDGMERISNLLGWENYEAFYHNRTEGRKYNVTDEEIDLIRSQNQLDIKLYEEALNLLDKGWWKP